MAPLAWAQDPPAVSTQQFLIAENMPEATICGEPGVPQHPVDLWSAPGGQYFFPKCSIGIGTGCM